MPARIESVWFQSSDGLRLHALRAGPRAEERLPVVCLPGISRTAEDFRTLIGALASGGARPRRAFALDSRGRGLSARDKNPANYSVPVELADLIAFLRAMQTERAILIGTSRGGILTMALASVMPQAIAGAVLNDVGPVLEMEGLLRIKGYLGKMSRPRSWQEAIAGLKAIMGARFPGFAERDWESYARRTWDDRFEPRADPALSAAFGGVDANNPPPALWPQFEALAKAAPILVLRGEHSDLLSRETVAEMQRRAPRMRSIEISGQGHAPVLESEEAIRPIMEFVARCDA
jgi:pimeloyl-ACP methyl ester carboxylesterase